MAIRCLSPASSNVNVRQLLGIFGALFRRRFAFLRLPFHLKSSEKTDLSANWIKIETPRNPISEISPFLGLFSWYLGSPPLDRKLTVETTRSQPVHSWLSSGDLHLNCSTSLQASRSCYYRRRWTRWTWLLVQLIHH